MGCHGEERGGVALLRDQLRRLRRGRAGVGAQRQDRRNFFVGSKVEIEDEDGGEPWGAAVRSVEEKCYAVNYDGYDSDELEWIPRDKILGVLYEVGSKVEIRDDDGGEPWGATIRRVKDAGYMINYDGHRKRETWTSSQGNSCWGSCEDLRLNSIRAVLLLRKHNSPFEPLLLHCIDDVIIVFGRIV